MTHPLRAVLDAAARGQFPDPDGEFDLYPSLGPDLDAIVAFTGRFALAADVSDADVRARYTPGDFSVPLSPAFLLWLAEAVDARPGTQDVVFVADAHPNDPPIPLVQLDGTDIEHPRVARAARYRDHLHVFTTPTRGGAEPDGILVLGRGVCDRWELAFEVAPEARGRGLGSALLESAKRLLPPGEHVWAQVAPGNAASLRTMTAAGFRPIGGEVLLHR